MAKNKGGRPKKFERQMTEKSLVRLTPEQKALAEKLTVQLNLGGTADLFRYLLTVEGEKVLQYSGGSAPMPTPEGDNL